MVKNKVNILIVIPARGGSQGIPRKNLRSLNGNPLIYYSIKTALSSSFEPDVYVSSDDDEILNISSKFGAFTLKRDPDISDAYTTLDPVIYDAYIKASKENNKEYDIIVTLQPTSPLLKTSSLDKALTQIIDNKSLDTIISAKDNTHLTWKKENNQFIPNYKERVNRQFLTPVFVETGGFLITRAVNISRANRIGKKVELFLLSNGEEIDIDTYEELNICEYYLRKKNVLFVTSGYKEIGFGHIYRTLLLANNIINHNVKFLVDSKSEKGYKKIKEHNYNVHIQKDENIINDIKKLEPDVIINDILDTNDSYIKELKQNNFKVINFEDLGSGAKDADLVINALYPEKDKYPNHYYGHKYFCARDEFLITPSKKIKAKVEDVLITFGGTDPNNLTQKVLDAIYDYCLSNNIKINIVLGFGYTGKIDKTLYKNVQIYNNVSNISDFMLKADLIFTSAGRTIYEITCIGTPTIVIAQNDRELTHLFVSPKNGFMTLGHANQVSKDKISGHFIELLKDYDKRKKMNEIMLSKNLKLGTKIVTRLIKEVIED